MSKRNIIGSEYGDTLTISLNSKKKTRIFGRGGDDFITSAIYGATNYLYGEAGNDSISSNEYTRYADGGEGDDL